MRLPAALTMTVVVATLAGTLADVGAVANAAGSSAVDYGATWTVDTSTNTLSEFAPHASGAATAIATIHGGATGLSAPSAVTVGPLGTVYVANSGNNSITEYPNGATGNTPPSATIKGSSTGLTAPSSITLAGGELWVTDPSTNVVEAFTAGSSGNELPAETIAGTKTGLNHPVGVAVDDVDQSDGVTDDGGGTEVYVINAPVAGSGSITGYSTEKLGDVAPGVKVTSSARHPLRTPTAILSAGEGSVWVTDGATDTLSNILVFPSVPGEPSGLPASEPLVTISGSATGIDTPAGLSLDALGQPVVANAGSHSLLIFAARAKGDVAPIRTVTGLGTTAGSPAAAAVLGIAPGAPTNFKVVIHRSAKSATATMTWGTPAVTGGGIIGYQAVAIDITSLESLLGGLEGGSIGGAISKKVDNRMARVEKRPALATSTHRATRKKLKLGHTYLFGAIAVNAFGAAASRPVIRTLAIASTPPQDVKASSSHHSISVHWKAPKNSGGDPVKSYRIEYGTCVPGSKGCKSHALVVPSKRRFATIRGLTPGKTYDVRIAAKTKHGLGALSANQTAVPLA